MKTLLVSLCVFYSTCFAADYGPPVGTPMPPFRAQDQNGRTLALKDILGPKGALIVFFRSADW